MIPAQSYASQTLQGLSPHPILVSAPRVLTGLPAGRDSRLARLPARGERLLPPPGTGSDQQAARSNGRRGRGHPRQLTATALLPPGPRLPPACAPRRGAHRPGGSVSRAGGHTRGVREASAGNTSCTGLRRPPSRATQRELYPPAPVLGPPPMGSHHIPGSPSGPHRSDPPQPLLTLPPAGGEHSSLACHSPTECHLWQCPQPWAASQRTNTGTDDTDIPSSPGKHSDLREFPE